MSLINKEISDFTVQAYHEGPSIPFQKRMCWASGLSFSSIRRTLPLFALRSWRIWQINTRSLRLRAARFIPFPVIPITSTKPGMTPPSVLRKSDTPCWQTHPRLGEGF